MEVLHAQIKDKDTRNRQLKNQLEHVRDGFISKINLLQNEKAKVDYELASRDSVQ